MFVTGFLKYLTSLSTLKTQYTYMKKVVFNFHVKLQIVKSKVLDGLGRRRFKTVMTEIYN